MRAPALQAAALLLASVLASALGPAAGALAAPSYRAQRVCGLAHPRAADCLAIRLLPRSLTRRQLRLDAAREATDGRGARAAAAEVPNPLHGFLTPEQLHAAYQLPTETSASAGQTVAVIDAFDDPTAEADLGVFDETFGLPPCTSANGCFRKLDEQGQASPLPPVQGEWAGEISIDVQMAHAICQSCHVLLVEASSEELTDLGRSVDAAVAAGASEISNSYAVPEEPAVAGFFAELNSDFYEHPGVVVTAASGDCGYLNQACHGRPSTANFPADSPDVLAVGGTALVHSGETWSSTVWSEAGGGCSQIFEAPPWQSAAAGFAATGCGEGRSVADVAAVADPKTAVDIYDSTPEGNGAPTGWTAFGGTSVASPIVAAEFALAGGAHGAAFPAATVYAHAGEVGALYDVVSGSNGSCGGATSCQAAVGFDGPTGLGSPLGLGAFASPGVPVNSSPPTISGVAEEGRQLSETPGAWSPSPTSTGVQWEDCDASGGACKAIAGATARTYTLAQGDLGATVRAQETAGNDAGVGLPASSAASAAVVSDVPELAGFTPSAGITGSEVTIEGSGLGGVSEVQFGKLAAHFAVVSSTRIEAMVPDGARNGKLSVSGAGGSATSRAKFEPTLAVSAFAPRAGKPGTRVTIKGVGFNASSSVSFDGTPASVVSVSAKKLQALVPAGAGSGAIAVSNSTAPVGTVFSAEGFGR